MLQARTLFPLLLVLALVRSTVAEDARHEIAFPDLPGYRTLKCDLHTHTVFSDGEVWPTVRVKEAWRQGLDALAITDHIEYQPHKDDVPTKHNRPYALAASLARERNLLLARGAEITRETPPGHFNALFIKDAVPLETKEFLDAIREANAQGAFVFWNHQGWKGEELGNWLEIHTTLYNNKWFQGMEICNGDEYYPRAHQWCLEKNLTMLADSDIHEPDLVTKNTHAEHRTMTLVFAKERTLEALQEALVQGRTAVWYKDQVIGRKEWLQPLFDASVRVGPPHLRTKDAVWVEVRNLCEVDITLERPDPKAAKPVRLVLPARSTKVLRIPAARPAERPEAAYTAVNFVIAPGAGLPVKLIPGGP